MHVFSARSAGWLLCLAVILMPQIVRGVTIYRFGGQGLQVPPEAGRPGVIFVQQDWANLTSDAGGEAVRLKMDGQTLRVLEYSANDNINIAPSSGLPPQLQVLFDRNTDTYWVSGKYLCGDRATLDCDGEYGPQGTIDIALEGQVFVERVRIFSRAGVGVVRDVGVHLSPQRFDSGSGKALRRPFAAEVRGNELPVLDIQFSSQQRSAALQLALGQQQQRWDIGEIQI